MISVSHRAAVERYHDLTLELFEGGDWELRESDRAAGL